MRATRKMLQRREVSALRKLHARVLAERARIARRLAMADALRTYDAWKVKP